MDVGELRALALFEGLHDDQLEELLGRSDEVAVEADVVLFGEGEPADAWWVLLEGEIELVRHTGRAETIVGRMDTPGRWAGGFRAWDERGVYLATGRGRGPGRVLRVPSAVLRDRFAAWFPLAEHLIEGVYGTARRIEANARQRESLVALGTLAAGLAHEINNPAAAAARAVESLRDTFATLQASLVGLARAQITAHQFEGLDALSRDLRPGPVVGVLDLADREEAVGDWLVANGVKEGYVMAATLAAAGADVEWCERAAGVLGPALEPGIEWVASSMSATSLLSELQESTRRVSELVGAVRSYSQMDRASMQLVDVTDGIESTLVMLGHRLRGCVEVVREYGADVPGIEAYAGELNQVWTNLVNNAIDAMDGVGTLRIATRSDGDSVTVEVADTGHGMPAEVAARAFDAFYTTKPVGEGTGLGLDIARRIVVERHGGTISIDSQPGGTVLSVTLPLRPGS